MSEQRMVKLAELWQRTSAKGSTYFSGFMGDAQLLMFDAGEKSHPTRPGETVRVWKLLVQERDPERRSQARQDGQQNSRRPEGPPGRQERATGAATAAQTGSIAGSARDRWPRVQGRSQDFDDLDSSIPF